jgi:hypothetical protein
VSDRLEDALLSRLCFAFQQSVVTYPDFGLWCEPRFGARPRLLTCLASLDFLVRAKRGRPNPLGEAPVWLRVWLRVSLRSTLTAGSWSGFVSGFVSRFARPSRLVRTLTSLVRSTLTGLGSWWSLRGLDKVGPSEARTTAEPSEAPVRTLWVLRLASLDPHGWFGPSLLGLASLSRFARPSLGFLMPHLVRPCSLGSDHQKGV